MAKPAEPGERFQGAQGQLGTALGPEASEELPVSTLGARCLSEVLAGSLPEPESSAAGDSPAADAGVAGHDKGMDEPDVEDAHGQQGIASLPHGYQLVPAMPYYQHSVVSAMYVLARTRFQVTLPQPPLDGLGGAKQRPQLLAGLLPCNCL